MYLTENNLIFDQENCLNEDPEYPDLFGRGDPIVGYVHDFVLRDMLGGTYGIIPDGASAIPLNVLAGQTYSYTFSTRLLEKYKPSDIHLVGYIMDYKGPLDSEILNAATCPLLETSVPYSKDQSLLKVYPNPNSGKFNIIFDTYQQGKVDVLVWNLQSQLVYRQIWYKDAGKGFLTITLDNLPTGIYFLELNTGEGISYQKIVVGR